MLGQITSKAFREAEARGFLSAPTAIGVKGGFVLVATIGQTRVELAARNASGQQNRRIFPSLQSLANFLDGKTGIKAFFVDAAGYQAPRPHPHHAQVSERLRRAHAALRPAEQY